MEDCQGYERKFYFPSTEQEEKEVVAFFNKFGFVVVSVLSQREVEQFVEGLWHNPNLLGKKGIDRNDPATWEGANWPAGGGQNKGFLPLDVGFGESWKIRQHPKIYQIFSLGLWSDKLICSIDRIGVMRPTKGILLPNGKKVDKKHWETDANFFHWDQNPWTHPNFIKVQGLVTFSSHTKESGGFHCVPGFVHHYGSWGVENMEFKQSGDLINVPPDDPMRKYLRKIEMPAGSLLIWDGRTPHGNYPNEGNSFRMVQYLTMNCQEEQLREFTARLTRNAVPPSVELTELGKKLTGLEVWK